MGRRSNELTFILLVFTRDVTTVEVRYFCFLCTLRDRTGVLNLFGKLRKN